MCSETPMGLGIVLFHNVVLYQCVAWMNDEDQVRECEITVNELFSSAVPFVPSLLG